jgi:hypothetical protein
MDSKQYPPVAWELRKLRGAGDGERFVLRFIEKNRAPGAPLWTVRRDSELTVEQAAAEAITAGIPIQNFHEALARARHDFDPPM